MSKIEGLKRIEFVSQGFKDILFSPGTKELVQSTANMIQANANSGVPADSEGFSSNVIAGGYGGGRYVGFVTAIDDAANEAESENKVLTGAVHP